MSTTPIAPGPNVAVTPEPRREAMAYAIAVVILVVGGAIVRTPILNWICGPGIVVACVALLGPRFARKKRTSSEGRGK